MAQVVAEAEAVGVTRMVTMGGDYERNEKAVELANAYPQVWAAVGDDTQSGSSLSAWKLRDLALDPRVIAIGEIGLDQSEPGRVSLHNQLLAFRECCAIAVDLGLPVSVHNRGATEDIVHVIEAHPGLRGAMHYFADGWEMAERFLDRGFYLSFSGLVTRPSRHELREVVKRCPADRLLLETDSPYGNAHKRMGVPNRPAYLVDTAEVVAELRGISLEELAEQETANALALFSRMK